MGLVAPNYEPDPLLAVRAGSDFITTRNVTVSLDQVWHGKEVTLASGTRLRHLKTEYAAECIPPLEYADIYFEVLTGDLAKRTVAVVTFEMNAPVAELPQLAGKGIALDVKPLDRSHARAQ